MWPYCGYKEIQEPRRKNLLIDYEKLRKLIGAMSYEELKRSHRGWVEKYLKDGRIIRQEEWSSSIAVGSKGFVENVKSVLDIRARGRDIIEVNDRYQLRERFVPYGALFSGENDDIGLENTYYWGDTNE